MGAVEYSNGVRRRVCKVQLPYMKMDALRSYHVKDVDQFLPLQ